MDLVQTPMFWMITALSLGVPVWPLSARAVWQSGWPAARADAARL